MHKRVLPLAAAAVVLAAAAPAAHAADPRYASPTGSGTACTDAAPCELYDAIKGAPANSEVIIKTGSYGSEGAPLSEDGQINTVGLNIHGEAGKPRPVIYSTTDYPMGIYGGNSRLSHVELQGMRTGPGLSQVVLNLSFKPGSVADDVVVRSRFGYACFLGNTQTIRNSVCRDTSPAGQGTAFAQLGAIYGPTNGTVRNSTLWSDAGLAINQSSIATRPMSLNLVNVIARTGSATAVINSKTTDNATITATTSNLGAVANAGGAVGPTVATNATMPSPVFVNSATGDFRQKPESDATIDRGTTATENGPFAYGGLIPRFIGAGTDIGADELTLKPTLSGPLAGNITATTATLTANVTPNGSETTYRFEYTPAGGTLVTVPAQTLGISSTGGPVSANVTGLQPSTAYTLRLVATNELGESSVAGSFVTPAAPVTPPPPGTGAAKAPALTKLKLSNSKVNKGKSAKLTFRLDKAATVKVVLQRKNSKKKYVRVRSLSSKRKAGTNTLTLSKKFLGSKLRSYRLSITATADGKTSKAQLRNVRVIKAAKKKR